MRKFILKLSLLIFIVGFLINLIWEFLHHYLYMCADWPFSQLMPLMLRVSAGDGLIILFFYFIGYLLNNNYKWIFNMKQRDYYFLILLGFFIAAFIEILNVKYLGRWSYNKYMPIIPWFNIGVTPVLQMMILPIIDFWIVKKILKK